jgi:hypothetical protein
MGLVGMIPSFSALRDELAFFAESNANILSNISSFFFCLFSSISLFRALTIASSASASRITNAARKFAIAFRMSPIGFVPILVPFAEGGYHSLQQC